jgi:hypothetical protein
MTSNFSISLLFTALTIQCFSQVDFGIRRQKLTPIFIDTTKENIFVYEVPNAILYFKQNDIKTFIDNPENKNILTNYGYKTFLDTLAKQTQRIKIIDYYFYYDGAQRDSIFKYHKEDLTRKKLNEEFYFLGAGLLLKGQFMAYSKADKKIITKGLIAKQEKGYLGGRTLEFYLPDKKSLYSIVTALGE